MSTFTWIPDYSPTEDNQPKVRVTKFGDGYEQRVAFGENTQPRNWTLSFSQRETAEADEIRDFLRARGAVESFNWTPPGEADDSFYVCRTWQRQPEKGGRWSITATFDEVFEPDGT